MPNRGSRRWATDRLVRFLLGVVREFAAAHPGAPRVGVGDLSKQHGGPFGPVHATHQNGLDADVYYPRRDRSERPPTLVSQIDRRLAQDLVDRFVAAGARLVYVGPNTGFTGPRGVVRVLWNHDNHLHVRIRATTGSSRSDRSPPGSSSGPSSPSAPLRPLTHCGREPERVTSATQAPTVPGLVGPFEEAVRQLREAGVSGVITYSDEACRLHAVSLPELEPVRAPSFEMCRPATATGGLVAVEGDVVWSGLGYGTIQTVLTRGELSRAVRNRLGITAASAGFRAVQAASLDEGRYIVLAESNYDPQERVLAGFDGSGTRFVHPRGWVGGASAIRPSPSGGYYALLGSDLPGAPVMFTRDGRAVDAVDGVGTPRGVAWSPDERWSAFATGENVYVFPTEGAHEPLIRIPLVVHDLDWTDLAVASLP